MLYVLCFFSLPCSSSAFADYFANDNSTYANDDERSTDYSSDDIVSIANPLNSIPKCAFRTFDIIYQSQ